MTELTMKVTTTKPYAETVALMRDKLADAGFGILTEIDIAATLKAKLDVDVEPQVILGACRPQLAHLALQSDPSIAALLPCNVVVRADGEGSIVEAINPQAMMGMAADAPAALREIADEARARIAGALDAMKDA